MNAAKPEICIFMSCQNVVPLRRFPYLLNPFDPVNGSGHIPQNTTGSRRCFEEAATQVLPGALKSKGLIGICCLQQGHTGGKTLL